MSPLSSFNQCISSKTLEIAFSRTWSAKFPSCACPWTLLHGIPAVISNTFINVYSAWEYLVQIIGFATWCRFLKTFVGLQRGIHLMGMHPGIWPRYRRSWVGVLSGTQDLFHLCYTRIVFTLKAVISQDLWKNSYLVRKCIGFGNCTQNIISYPLSNIASLLP